MAKAFFAPYLGKALHTAFGAAFCIRPLNAAIALLAIRGVCHFYSFMLINLR